MNCARAIQRLRLTTEHTSQMGEQGIVMLREDQLQANRHAFYQMAALMPGASALNQC
jgi:hypothetical protein